LTTSENPAATICRVELLIKNGGRDNLGAVAVQNCRKTFAAGWGFRRPYLICPNASSPVLYIFSENDPRGSFGNQVPYVVKIA